MSGRGRTRVLAVRSPDPVMSVVGPLGLAASVTTCLVVDLVGDLNLPSPRTLADLAADGPRLEELSPGRAGVALIGAGALPITEAIEVVDQLAARWPAVVVRPGDPNWPGSIVPVVPLYPGLLARTRREVAVWQPTGSGYGPPGPGPVLPRLGARLVRSLLSGRMPGRSRWVRSWEPVWELPWA